MTKFKIVLPLIILLVFAGLFPWGNFSFAQKPLEVGYPNLPSILTPTTTSTLLPDYIRYLFYLALAISGIVAMGILVFAGFRYTTSAGNPGIQSDARDQITSAFIGIAVLLGSFILLNTINPQLTILSSQIITNRGVILCPSSACSVNDPQAQKYTSSISDFQSFQPQSLILQNTSFNELAIYMYPGVNYTGSPTEITSEGAIPLTARSMEISWRIPGVYLYEQPNFQGKFRVATVSNGNLGDFNDKVRSVRIVSADPVNRRLGAILFEDADFRGQCDAFSVDSQKPDVSLGNGVSSLVVFQEGPPQGAGVTFYENENFEGASLGPQNGRVEVGDLSTYVGIGGISGDWNDKITSLNIDGQYLAVLFENINFGGKCQVFTQSDSNLRNDPLGQCGWWAALGQWEDCVSSFKIFPVSRP